MAAAASVASNKGLGTAAMRLSLCPAVAVVVLVHARRLIAASDAAAADAGEGMSVMRTGDAAPNVPPCPIDGLQS
jgi:hypothetical protein